MNQEKIGKFIAEKRKEKKLSQKELAEKLKVTDRSVSNWENGKNMPDLSLFKSLCEILGVSINELLSGEELNKDEYQDRFEENIINLEIINRKKIIRRIIIIGFIIFSIFLIIIELLLLYENVELPVKYDERVMVCNFENEELIYEIKGTSSLYVDYIEKTINNTKYYIFHNTISLANKKRNRWEYAESLAKIINGEEHYFMSSHEFDEDYDLYDNIKVYYSDKSLNKLANISEDFAFELNDLYEMCSLY